MFGEGDVTIVMNAAEAVMYVGSTRVESFTGILVGVGDDGPRPSVTVRFPHGEGDGSMGVEANARLLRALRWVNVHQ